MSTYTTEASVALLVAGDGVRLTVLLDRDRDGVADAGVLDAAIADAGTLIDASLAQRDDVPFDDAPATPAIIELCAKYLVAAELYGWNEATSEDSKRYAGKAQQILDRLLDGTYTIPGGSGTVDGDAGRVAITYSADEPKFSGRDANGDRRWRGF